MVGRTETMHRRSGGKRKLGIRHLQLLLLTFLGFVDGVALDKRWFEDGGTGKKLINRESELRTIEVVLLTLSSIVRFLAPYVVFTVNNKYLTIGLSFIEAATNVVIPHFLLLSDDTRKYALGLSGVLIFSCQIMRYPITLNIIAKWIPPHEITRAIAVVEAGGYFGRSTADFTLKSTFVKNNIFYMLAVGKVIFIVLYFFFGAQDPQTCWILPKDEWHYLCKEIGFRRKIARDCYIPWTSIFRVPMLYGLMCSSIAYRWFYIDFVHFRDYVPGYEEAVYISTFFFPFIYFFCAWGIDVMIAKEMITKNNIRKIWHSLAYWGSSICICFMCFYSREPEKVVVHFIFASMFCFSYSLAEVGAIFDMSPNYAPVLHSIITVPALAVAFMKAWTFDPTPAQLIGAAEPFRDNLYVWHTVAFVLFGFNYGFLMLGDIQWCQFDAYNAVDWRQESIISYP